MHIYKKATPIKAKPPKIQKTPYSCKAELIRVGVMRDIIRPIVLLPEKTKPRAVSTTASTGSTLIRELSDI